MIITIEDPSSGRKARSEVPDDLGSIALGQHVRHMTRRLFSRAPYNDGADIDLLFAPGKRFPNSFAYRPNARNWFQ